MNRMRLGALCVVVFGLALWGLGRIDVLGQSPPAPAADPAAEIEAAYAALEAKLVAQLKDPAAWTDEGRKDATCRLIQAAGAIRSEAAIPVLVEHLTWSTLSPSSPSMLLTPSQICPPVGGLAKIGLPSVPELLKVIAGPSPDRSTKTENELRTRFAMLCLIEVYQAGGQGDAMALRRVALESEKSTGEARERLLAALKMFEGPPARK
jgi:hypothetical protein